MKSDHLKYRSDIDGLRAVAVLAVVFYHFFPNQLRGGFT
jgi:peptidoglycan/LPS O-acetylase OafA/YrhL